MTVISRAISGVLVALIAAWLIAHLLSLGPIGDVVDFIVGWVLGLVSASAVVAGLAGVAMGVLLGRSRPAWLHFVQVACTVATVGGCGLIVFGLVLYRDTEPPDVRWIVAGLVLLVGAAAVHGWVAFTERKLT